MGYYYDIMGLGDTITMSLVWGYYYDIMGWRGYHYNLMCLGDTIIKSLVWEIPLWCHRDGLAEVNLLLSVNIYVFVHELLAGKFDFEYNVDHLSKAIFENGFSKFPELYFTLIGQRTLFSVIHSNKTWSALFFCILWCWGREWSELKEWLTLWRVSFMRSSFRRQMNNFFSVEQKML